MLNTGNLSTASDNFKLFLDNNTSAEIDTLINTAILDMQVEVTGGSLNGETLASVLTSGQYGLSHAAMVHKVLTGIKEEGALEYSCAGFLTCAYFYDKELQARGTDDVSTWNLDSRLDFLMTIVTVKEFLNHAT